MTRYYTKWAMNPLEMPKSPEERMKLWQSLLEKTKADLQAGALEDWGITDDLSEGFSIMEASDETERAFYTLKWMPYINVECKTVLTVDQSLEALKKFMASMKK